MILHARKLHPAAALPRFATSQAACFDLTAVSRGPVNGRSRVYSTGFALDIPKGYYVELYIRSGLAFNRDFILANGVGIIDADFTGEVKCKLAYLGDGLPDWPMPGDRIAQGRLVRMSKTQIEWTTEQKETERGENGFGSTGR
jgi:dUTP pyrophosphatase